MRRWWHTAGATAGVVMRASMAALHLWMRGVLNSEVLHYDCEYQWKSKELVVVCLEIDIVQSSIRQVLWRPVFVFSPFVSKLSTKKAVLSFHAFLLLWVGVLNGEVSINRRWESIWRRTPLSSRHSHPCASSCPLALSGPGCPAIGGYAAGATGVCDASAVKPHTAGCGFFYKVIRLSLATPNVLPQMFSKKIGGESHGTGWIENVAIPQCYKCLGSWRNKIVTRPLLFGSLQLSKRPFLSARGAV